MINAPQTFESHNFWSDRWTFKIHTYSETGIQDISIHVKIKPIGGLLKVVALQGPLPRNLCWGYKSHMHLSHWGESFFAEFCSLPGFSTCFSPLSNTKNTNKHPKNTSKLLDSSLFTKNTMYYSYTQSSSPWF